jgi:hypothetical protein
MALCGEEWRGLRVGDEVWGYFLTPSLPDFASIEDEVKVKVNDT